jgi:hypothetical protein
MRTYFLRINFIEIAIINAIEILNPINWLEKTSKKNPPVKATYMPEKLSFFSKRFQKIIKMKIELKK